MSTSELEHVEAFAALVEALELRYFSAVELMFIGHSHGNVDHPAYGLNPLGPGKLWDNIRPAAKVADCLREASGGLLTILSANRSPAYNRAIGGASKSEHMSFSALDLRSDTWSAAKCFDWRPWRLQNIPPH
ncbi:Peptidase M15 [Pseudovibrio axinellae]|uniref:Peptidase M15 n=1 Tax=Pseudovibrio axinellae TaxID=989403 RepID=A0A161VBU3_9HYPH|nr:D-Ala-D-Ala carboxypeptidase family metallohydrolase [Pseudovibrio axinellae]KZL16838.1 Peptidase M15 [Pseudovibrio axinellae]SER67345.1 Peptidase M15 [Pseudovibrio axinellae]